VGEAELRIMNVERREVPTQIGEELDTRTKIEDRATAGRPFKGS